MNRANEVRWILNDTRKKEALRNNPHMKPHEYSDFCSCGSCHSISLYADAIAESEEKRLKALRKVLVALERLIYPNPLEQEVIQAIKQTLGVEDE